jgi:hypothetical protein
LTPAARKYLYGELGREWIDQRSFLVDERIGLAEAQALAPWLRQQKEQQEEQGSM